MRTPIPCLIVFCGFSLISLFGHALTLEPNLLVLPVGGVRDMQVSIDVPAQPGGISVFLVINGVDATAPLSVTIPEGDSSAAFPVTAGTTTGQGTIAASYEVEVDVASIHVVEPLVFSDGFEAGNTLAWSSTFPPPQATSVYDLQDITSPNHPTDGTLVTVMGVVCTAIDSWNTGLGSFWVQESAGGEYSGIRVTNLAGTDVSALDVSDIVNVTGTYKEFYDESEIVLVSFAVVSPGSAPTPEPVLPGQVATGQPYAEAYEGVLVQLPAVTVTEALNQYGEFTVTDGLLIDDDLFEISPPPQVGDSFSSLVGVMRYTFGDTKLEPRSAADVVP